ncbi:unnamed protein product [Fraxinus pennsylvanica]|uniref:Uncharacterized protein n=1 Tax=Fraxinus pennsylvanica TaxID=56036 RepID=A0AAD2DUI5_9LAMI|nr:unnamed protein product [Fraxinus pennsylvanica]
MIFGFTFHRFPVGHRALLSEGIVVTGNSRNDTVDSLFNQNEKSWDWDKLQTLFSPCIVSDIGKIYLSPEEAEDRMFWSLERNGCFSVRSCYRLIYSYIG